MQPGSKKNFFSRKNLRSIFYNLITNSIKYRSPKRTPEITIDTIEQEDHLLEIRVRDNGIGIKKTDIEKVFTPFKRIHHGIEGSGMGMNIVKRIIDNNNGIIEVESEEDKGTIIRIFLKEEIF